jgi:predicted Zn-dependent peptidase
MLAALITSPKLNGITKERKVIIEEALEEINEHGVNVNPDNIAAKVMWPDEAIGEPILGSLKSIRGITSSDIREHISKYYTPDNAVFIAAGNVKKEQVLAAGEKFFSSWTGKRTVPEPSFSNTQEAPKVVFVSDTDSQVRVNMVFRGLPKHHENTLETWFLRWLLCCGGTSRMYKNLREEKGYVYSVHSSIDCFNDAGSMTIGFSTSQNNLIEATKATFEEIRLLLTNGVPGAEVERVKKSYLFDLDYSMDNDSQLLTRYARGVTFNRIKSVEDDKRLVMSITSESILRTARQIFKPEHLNFVAVGCYQNKDKKIIENLVKDLKF